MKTLVFHALTIYFSEYLDTSVEIWGRTYCVTLVESFLFYYCIFILF